MFFPLFNGNLFKSFTFLYRGLQSQLFQFICCPFSSFVKLKALLEDNFISIFVFLDFAIGSLILSDVCYLRLDFDSFTILGIADSSELANYMCQDFFTVTVRKKLCIIESTVHCAKESTLTIRTLCFLENQ